MLLVTFAGAGARAEDKKGDLYATFKTSMGDIVVKLYEKDAPKTVANFVGLATGDKDWTHPSNGKPQKKRPLYNGTYFHRVIPKFMIQGGDPFTLSDGDPGNAGRGGPGYKFEDELNNGHVFDKPGYLAMANSGPNTNGSQFFITEVATPHLNNKHTIFGEVVEGVELVPKIAAAGNMKVQLKEVVISRK
jgi:peptidyl-prolyl cis-trans isomerase A (cyclophilin A)